MTTTAALPTRRLDGRTALVTGSTSGIGAAVARSLAAAGARVVVSGRDADRGTFAADATAAAGGHLDVLVNNAGTYPATSTPDLADDDLDAMLALNVRAPHVLVAALVPAMAERGSGAVITVGSWMARTGLPSGAMYSATKAADEQLTRSWAAEYGPRGVRVNTVAPGATLTPGNAAASAVLDAMTASTPAGVVVQPEDVAAAVLFLASDDARMVHGTTLSVDGGISATRPV